MLPQRRALLRAAAIGGAIGPAALATALVALTLLQREFLRGLGWDPLRAPTMDWPSGLALGPLGGWMTATFLLCGALMALLAAGLWAALPGRASRAGATLIGLAGVAMCGLSAPTDPTLTTVVRTPAGLLHDASFALLGLTLLPGVLLVAAGVRGRAGWRAVVWLGIALAAAIGPAFLIKGPLFYLFLALALAWFPAAARCLWRSATA